MATNATGLLKLALLIDGDNVSATYMPYIARKAEERGVIAVRRIYGQFAGGKMKSWEKHVGPFDLTRIDVKPLTKGKNATDMKLVIEAMDMLYGRQLDGFCIASSDGDFTPLVARIRNNGVDCYGFGMKKAPAKYKEGFDHFYECDTEIAAEKKGATRRAAAPSPKTAPTPSRGAAKPVPRPNSPKTVATPPSPTTQRPPTAQPTASPKPANTSRKDVPQHIVQAVLKIVRSHNGSASFRDIGNELPTAVANFKSKDYGFGTTKALLKALHNKHGLSVTKDGQVVLTPL